MVEEVPRRRLSRRTRTERNKRRERYLLSSERHTESDVFSYELFATSGDSVRDPTEFVNCDTCHCHTDMGNKSLSNANQALDKPKDHLYKILVIGDLGTGKTSIIKRYVHRFFTQHYRATIGVDFALKILNWDDNTIIRLQLWDIAGQERYGNMTRVYYKEAVGAFIVFDVTRRTTFESVANWKSDLDSKVQLPDGSQIPCVLLANKCDQPKEGLVANQSKMDEYCKENNYTAWFETSARDNINIDEAARALVEKILEYETVINSDTHRGDQFSITKDSSGQMNGGKSCSC